ncbi:MAG: phenylalanine--tRNA ligase subunit beta [Acidithiobacillus sp.]|jgi:phenylalanyl-tRNA synthetase beta chain|uniref:Phenylalanine--tRNA ligase subunit beta n=1 Tax=Acidithiobacillus ferruginosus TaxID=3063951 RepID=A0ACD5IF58_9PROT|nr:phenylalanine--tRNA ligase subunit beta [Acidithiobacillus ferruginosus]MBU2813152.1 phenylalanine--tRNA ligase subunit beta [Acidithiobacillus ferruginosus]
MRVSVQWLRELLEISWDTEETARRLTMGGIEVEAIEDAAPSFRGVVVAAVRSVAPHPEADKLRVAEVDAGDGQLRTIVCGADNLAAGQRVPLALPGALLPGEHHIATSVLRGISSEGMLCAAAELGLDDGSSGLLVLDADAPVGADLRAYLGLDDQILTLGITPNRGDALSVTGVARDLFALGAEALSLPTAAIPEPAWAIVHPGDVVPGNGGFAPHIAADAQNACRSYTTLWIEGVPERLPDYLRERLRRAGQRCIHPVVDLLNLQMLETGQPLHAFDAETLQGDLTVRWAQTGEILDALDGRDLPLESDMLVIADDAGPVALAGIIGGRRTAVTAQTRSIVLESAFFQPGAIQGRARRLGLQTDAAMRFERGVDFTLGPVVAASTLQRFATLGMAHLRTERSCTILGQLPEHRPIPLRRARLARILGMDYEDDVVEAALTRLGLHVNRVPDGWQAIPPSHRFDLRIEADLIEEVGRIYGYERLPAHRPEGTLQPLPMTRGPQAATLRSVLQARDYHEVITYSFISRQAQNLFTPDADAPALLNPLSADLAVMRASLWPGLLQALQFNMKRQQERVRIFELGRVFSAHGQRLVLGGCIVGPADRESWAEPLRAVDFYDLKGDVSALLALWPGTDFTFRPLDAYPALHPGQAAEICVEDRRVGVLGALHPTQAAEYDLDKSPFFFYLDVEWLGNLTSISRFASLSPFPALRRDIALVIPNDILAGTVLDTMRAAASGIVRNITIFDRYQGSSLVAGTYSLAFALLLQDVGRTLTDTEVQAEMDRLLVAVRQLGSIELRA